MIGRMKRRPFLPPAQHRGTERSLLSLCVRVCFRIYVKLAGCHLKHTEPFKSFPRLTPPVDELL